MRLLCSVAAVAFVLKALLALFTVGTNDMSTWDHDLVKLRAAGFADLYKEGVQYSSPSGRPYPNQPFIHPPAVLTGLRLLGALQSLTGLPFRFWLRIACGFADVGMLAMIWGMFPGLRGRAELWLLAASPVSILISGFHGNTDPIMICFVVLTVFLMTKGQYFWAAAAFGLACSVKLVPLIYAPAIMLCLPSFRTRARWIAIAAGTWVALSMPYLILQPLLIFKTVLGYGSVTGLWGFYFLTRLLQEAGFETAHALYAPASKWLALTVVAALPCVLKSLRLFPSLFAQFGMITFLFLFLSPGFGLQYLAWTVPWVVVLGVWPMAAYYVVTGLFLVSVYLESCKSVGLHAYSDLLTSTNFGMLALMGCVCWVTIGVILPRYLRVPGAQNAPIRV